MSVFWTRGYRREGNTIHMGVVVVRPGWVAFLPIGVPMGPSEQFALGAQQARGGVAISMNVPWQGRYPINQWWQHGEQVFDQEVQRALQQPGAAMLGANDAGLVSRKHTTAFVPYAPGVAMITLDQPPPPLLVTMWRPGVLPFDEKKAIVASSIATAVLFAVFGAFTALIFVVEDGELNPIPLIMFAIIAGVVWFAVVKRMREHERDVAAAAQASGPVGPYR